MRLVLRLQNKVALRVNSSGQLEQDVEAEAKGVEVAEAPAASPVHAGRESTMLTMATPQDGLLAPRPKGLRGLVLRVGVLCARTRVCVQQLVRVGLCV